MLASVKSAGENFIRQIPETSSAPVAAKITALKTAANKTTLGLPNWLLMLVSLASAGAAAWYFLIKKKTRRGRHRR